jgi:hypothetical protein
VRESSAVNGQVDSRRARAGRAVEQLGRLGLPLGAGLLAGYWAADLGAAWLPTMLELVLGVTLFSLAAIGAGAWLAGRATLPTRAGRRLRRRMVATLALVALALGARLALHFVKEPSPLTLLAPAEFETSYALDLARYRDYERELESVVARVERLPAFAAPSARVLSAAEERSLAGAWRAAHDTAFALDQVRRFYEDYYRFDPSRLGRSRHVRSYLLTYAAELALYEKSVRFVAAVQRNPRAESFLDAPRPEGGLAAGSYSRFRDELNGSSDQARVLAGERYLAWLEGALDGRAEVERAGLGWLRRAIDRHLGRVERVASLRRAQLAVAGDFQSVQLALRRVWFPAQRGIAEWLGDTRTRRAGWYLITAAQAEAMAEKLEPGDLLLSRKNWYLSNVALPGFWPHAILYLGTPEELLAAFDRPGEPTAGFGERLAALAPGAWRRYREGEGGRPYRVVEAVSEGVVFNTLEHAAGDYLVALRPRLDRAAKAAAIAESFAHVAKPYDFEFDFATDHALVCTELVWRSYRPAPGKAGLDFALVEVAGRPTLPANEIAALYAAERGREDRQFDFVAFLDASERERRAFFADEEAFARTPARAKWDILQR